MGILDLIKQQNDALAKAAQDADNVYKKPIAPAPASRAPVKKPGTGLPTGEQASALKNGKGTFSELSDSQKMIEDFKKKGWIK